MSLNQKMIALLEYMRGQMAEFPELLPKEQLDRVGESKDWSAKDNFFHALEWAGRRLSRLEGLERGEGWPAEDFGDYEEVNETIFQGYKDQSWDDALALAEDTYQRGLAYLNRLPEEDLHFVREGEDQRPIWRILVDNFVSHPMIHLWEQLIAADQINELNARFGDSYVALLLELDQAENFQGGVYYNLACLQALTGRQDQAVKTLKKALKLAPALVEWSQQDSDLDSLRDLPEFQAIYQ